MKFSKALLLAATCTGSAFAVAAEAPTEEDNGMLDSILDLMKGSMQGILDSQGGVLQKLCEVPAKANTCMELLDTTGLGECEAVQGLFDFEDFEDMELANLFMDLDIGGICNQDDGNRRLLSVEPAQVFRKLKAVRDALEVTLQFVPKGPRKLMSDSPLDMKDAVEYLCASDGSGMDCVKDYLANQQEFFDCIGPVLEELVPNFQNLTDVFAGMFEGEGLNDLLVDLLGGLNLGDLLEGGEANDEENDFNLADFLGGGGGNGGLNLGGLLGGEDNDNGFDLSDLLPGGGDEDNYFNLGDLLGGGGLNLGDIFGGGGFPDIEELFGFNLGSQELEDVLGSLLEGFRGRNGSMDVMRERVLASIPNRCATNFGGHRCMSAGMNLFDESADQDKMCAAVRKAGCCFGNIAAVMQGELAVEESLCDALGQARSANCKDMAKKLFPPMEFPTCNVAEWACPVTGEEESFGFVEIVIEDCDFSLLASLDVDIQAGFSAAFAEDIQAKIDVSFEVGAFVEAAGGCMITIVVPDGDEEAVKDEVNENPSFAGLGSVFEKAGISSAADFSGAAEARVEVVTGGEEEEKESEETNGAGAVLPGLFAAFVSLFCALQ